MGQYRLRGLESLEALQYPEVNGYRWTSPLTTRLAQWGELGSPRYQYPPPVAEAGELGKLQSIKETPRR